MPPKIGKGNPLQKRGQIKAKIFEDLFKGDGGVTATENRPSFHLYGCYFFFLSLVELVFQSTDPPKRVKGDSQRKRSQIKAKIFEDIFKSLSYFASKAGIKKQEEMEGSSDGELPFISPPSSTMHPIPALDHL